MLTWVELPLVMNMRRVHNTAWDDKSCKDVRNNAWHYPREKSGEEPDKPYHSWVYFKILPNPTANPGKYLILLTSK